MTGNPPMSMEINTDLVPSGPYREVVVLIDVLRTCTTAPLLLERGVAELALTPSLGLARQAAKEGQLLVGERQGVPPEGFNYGNSPGPLARADLAGERVMMVSENAPRWLEQVANAEAVLLGSLYNAAAVAELVGRMAPARVDLVCSGFAGEPDMDDAVTAALIAGLLKRERTAVTFVGATRFSAALARAVPDPLDALWRSTAGRYLRRLGLEDDIAFAAQLSVSDTVPHLVNVKPVGDAALYEFAAHGAVRAA